MNPRNIVLFEGEFSRLKTILARTQRALSADLVALIERSGQTLVHDGPAQDIDLTALASLAAANLAATDGLARVVGEPEFSVLYHQGKHRNIHISAVMKRFCLVVVFNDAVSLGMVRLRVKHAGAYLEELFGRLNRQQSQASEAGAAPKAAGTELEFTDEEIDKLFGN